MTDDLVRQLRVAEGALKVRFAELEAELAREIADHRALHDRYERLEADADAIRREHRGRVGGRVWTLYVCPSCKRHATDSDQIDCDCDVDAKEITVAPVPDGLATGEWTVLTPAEAATILNVLDAGLIYQGGESVRAAIAKLRATAGAGRHG